MTRTTQDWLDLLQEECAEVIQAISKVRRFGMDEVSPRRPELGTAGDRMIQEFADLAVVMEHAERAIGVTFTQRANARAIKLDRLRSHPR